MPIDLHALRVVGRHRFFDGSSSVSNPTPKSTLNRSLGFWSLVFYGIGDILGAGIYGLVGEVAGEAGPYLWLSFLLAMLTAGLTGLSYAELVSRIPQSAGEATYTLAAFQRTWLAFLVGWMVFCSGVVSMSAVAHASGSYVQSVWPGCPVAVVWVVYVFWISAINFWGIQQSSLMNILFTLLEISGLLVVIIAGAMYFGNHEYTMPQQPAWEGSFFGIMQGATLAFFAYIGFEDMINVAEEVKKPERTFPKTIITAVLVCGTLYLLVSLACLAVLPVRELGQSRAPLLDVVRVAAPVVPPMFYTVIALIAVSNTGLLNSIMASRLLYGMANQGLLPGWLSAVHPRTQTPHWAVLLLAAIALGLIFSGTLTSLASTTSVLLLLVFSTVNAALLKMRLREGRDSERFSVPLIVPIAAILTCFMLILFLQRAALWWVLGILAVGGGLAILAHRRQIAIDDLESDPSNEAKENRETS